jgi:hypothetical protein
VIGYVYLGMNVCWAWVATAASLFCRVCSCIRRICRRTCFFVVICLRATTYKPLLPARGFANKYLSETVLRIHIFLSLLDPDPDPLVRCMNADPDPSIIKQK